MFFNFGPGFVDDDNDNRNDSDKPQDDYYKVLGVDEKTGDDEIKKAYRKLSMIHHPDKNGNTDESKKKFQEINQAYETLSDQNERRKYDMMRKMGGTSGFGHGPNMEHVFHFNSPGGQGLGGGGGGGAGIPDEILQLLFGLGRMPGGGGMHGFPGMRGMPSGGGPGMVFQTFHGNHPNAQAHAHAHAQAHAQAQASGGNGSTPRVVPVQLPETIIKTVSLTLEQSYNGCTVPIEIDRQIPDNDIVRIERETLHVQIPKGILQGDSIILNEFGNMNEIGAKGDVRIMINILQHPVFKVENIDLHIEKTISLKDALCGFNFEIIHLNGRVFQLSNKPGNIIKPGSIKTIPNLGLEKNGETGSIKIKFNVEFPESLSQDQIQTLSSGL